MKKNLISLLMMFVVAGLFAKSVDFAITVNGNSVSFETPDLKTKLNLKGTELEGKKVQWNIEDPYIVSVSEDGTFTSLSGGTTKVTASADGKSVDFFLTVEEPNRPATKDAVDPKNISGKIDILMCGDSIMREYKPNDVDQYGLGQAMKYFWDSSKVSVDNSISNGGRSTRYFWNEPNRWKVVKEKLEANKKSGKTTVVFFSFGHNDQRSLKGGDSKVGDYGASFTFAEKNQNGTTAGTHYDYIERYIVETRELGGIPVMVSPFVRKYVSNGKITEKGRHNMENPSNGEKTGRGNYPLAMKKACEKHNAIFVDMTSMSAELVEKYAAQNKTNLIYISSDSTHERTLGALELASLVTKDLKKQGYFADYIIEAEPRVFVSARNLSFGRVFPDKEDIISFNISFYDLKDGIFTVKAPKGYSVSLDKKGEFTSSLQIDCSKIAYGTEIFVKFAPKKVASYKGNLVLSHSKCGLDFGNITEPAKARKQVKISLDGAGKEKQASGKNTKIQYLLIDSENKYTAEAVCEQGVTSLPVKVSGLEVLEPKREFSPGDDGDFVALYSIPGGVWPVNDGGVKNDDMFIELAVPASGKNMIVNYLSFYAGSYGSKNMRFHVYYSTDKKFKNPVAVLSNGKCSYENVTEEFASGELGIKLKGKDTLYFRIYPAYKDTKENTQKAFMLSNVVISGVITK